MSQEKHNSKFRQKESLIKKSSVAKKETIINKKILVLREQGIGEEILFSSMYKELIALNNNLKIETDKRLISIFLKDLFKIKYLFLMDIIQKTRKF